MFREFFLSGPRRQILSAWAGLVVFVGHALFRAWLKYALNDWYTSFYDELQDNVDVGSGDADHFLNKRAAVRDELVRFAWIVMPAVVVNPVGKWIASNWKFGWRVSLMSSYIAHMDVNERRPVEGIAQRIHEDSARFESGITTCVTLLLDSFLTLVVFIPVLLEVGAQTNPAQPSWLLAIAAGAAIGGLAVSVCVGRKLVGIEVNNQATEARLRTKLVLLEQQTLANTVGSAASCDDGVVDDRDFGDASPRPPARTVSSSGSFSLVLAELWTNYRSLYTEFCKFNLWVSLFEQVLVISPYVLVAPLMFADDPVERISLGTLTKVANSFGHVFSSMAVLGENWGEVNNFRSTVRRLREFETQQTCARRRSGHLELREDAITEHAPAVELE